jgi:hypothetical protein
VQAQQRGEDDDETGEEGPGPCETTHTSMVRSLAS